MATNEENKDVYETYKKDCIYSVDEFLKIHNFSERGLTKGQVEENKTKYGLNIIKQSKPKKWYHFLLKSLFSSFNIILLSITLLLILYRCSFARSTKLCEHYSDTCFNCYKFFFRIF